MTDDTTTAPADTPDTAPVAPQWSPEAETLAREWGWKSTDEWKGEPPPGFIDNPERYVERFDKLPPVKKLQEKLADQERKTEERLRKIEAVTSKALERERASYTAQIEALKAQKLQAVETGDVEAFKALDRREAALTQAVAEPAPKADGVPPDHKAAIDQWSVGKDWFRNDAIKTQAAVVLYGQAQNKGLSDPKAILAYVDAEMAKTFASPAQPQQQQSMVDPGLTFGGQSADPFAKLPKDAKDTFQRFVKQGLFTDDKAGRAAYAEDYNAA